MTKYWPDGLTHKLEDYNFLSGVIPLSRYDLVLGAFHSLPSAIERKSSICYALPRDVLCYWSK